MEPQLIERNCLSDVEIADSCSPKLSQVSANVQTFSKIFCECSDVRARRTRDTRVKIESAVEVVLDQLTVRLDGGEVMNTNAHRLSFDALTTTRKFVESSPLNFFC